MGNTLSRKYRSARNRPRFTSCLQIAIGGGDHAYIYDAGVLLADALELAFLQ